MSEIIYALKDSYLLNVLSYKPVFFTEQHNDAGFAIRVIELYRFHKMKESLSNFSKITGHNIDGTLTSVEEIKCLLKRGMDICSRARAELEKKEQELKNAKSALLSAENGRGSRPEGYGSIKDWVSNLHQRVKSFESSVDSEKFNYSSRCGLFNLLRPVIEEMLNSGIKGIPVKALSLIPYGEFSSILYDKNKFMNNCYLSSHGYAWDEMNQFEYAINQIIETCTLPSDRYVLNSGGKERTMHYRYYYSEAGKNIRTMMSAKEYAECMTSTELNFLSKENMMHKSI